MKACCSVFSSSSSSTIIRPARLPNRRNSVPLPTPAAAAMSSIVTASAPRSAMSRRAASSSSARLRAASPRSVAERTPAIRPAGRWLTVDHFNSAGINRTAVRFRCARISPEDRKEMDMSDIKVLVLLGSLRAASINRQLAELAVETAPDGVSLQLFDRLGELPFYNEDIDNEDVAEAVTALRDVAAGADAALRRHPRVQRQHSWRPQERHRLAVPAVRQQRAEGQAAGRHRRGDGPVRRRVGARRDPQIVRHRRAAGGRGSRSCRCRRTRSTGSIRGRMPRSPRTCATSSASWPQRLLGLRPLDGP